MAGRGGQIVSACSKARDDLAGIFCPLLLLLCAVLSGSQFPLWVKGMGVHGWFLSIG